MADSNKPIVPGGDTVGTVGEVYLSKNDTHRSIVFPLLEKA